MIEPNTLPVILVVDDSPTTLMTIATSLDQLYDVRALTSGTEALELLDTIRPDLVILDVMMPDLDGYETCRRLKALPDFKDVPVLFNTALNTPDDENRCFAAGGADFITKPFNPVTMRARIQTHLLLRQLQQRLKALQPA
ncbi:MAG: hypothetical protein RJA44_1888 [Pseudomonadota bacterium]|jgi:putative two-component system response regulator